MTNISLNTSLNIEQSLATAIDCDVLIIGAGLAGLSTALSLPSSLQVTVLSKKELSACSSHYAQGGIAASLAADDSVDEHIEDTLIAGDGLCDDANTSTILAAGSSAVAWLQQQGVPFTLQTNMAQNLADSQQCTKKNTTVPDELHLTQEGGHGRRRVAHADDATGQHIMQTLGQQLQSADNITVLTGFEALELLTDKLSNKQEPQQSQPTLNANPVCQGALVFDSINQRLLTIRSRAVVLASGGLGQLFKRATAPNVCLGDGLMMAWQAGCRLANLEFVQFHPTGLVLDNSNFLISEALRGEGAYLRCPLTGKRFMHKYDSRLELAPRDIVARAIAEQIGQNGLGYVHLDISHQPANFIYQHFPQIAETLDELGIDMATSPIPVAPTAHYTCGGVVATTDGLTDVVGLYAAGEVAYTGLHGANRLASNSLLECVVVGRRIAEHLPRYLNQCSKLENNQAYSSWSAPKLTNDYVVTQSTPTHFQQIPSEGNFTVRIPSNSERLAALKELMSSHLGIIRNESALQSALKQLSHWLTAAQTCIDTPEIESITDAETLTEQLDNWRWQRLLRLAMLMLQSALSRKESRGGHFRSDRPDKADAALVSVVASPKHVNDVNKTILSITTDPVGTTDIEAEARLRAAS